MASWILPKSEQKVFRIILECVSFVFQKNLQCHNLLSRFTDLYQSNIFLLTLESGIDVGQGISVGPGKFAKKNKRRALNKRRASDF